MTSSMERLSANEVKFIITIPTAVFEEKTTAAFRTMAKSINIPGFRKGKAPRNIVERFYGAEPFMNEAFGDAYPIYYEEAVKEHGVTPVDRPRVDVETMERGQDVVFSVEVYVKPDVELPAYKGVEVEKIEYPVEDEDIQHELEHAMERVARWVDVEGAASEGDRVTMDYAGSIDGIPFEGGAAQDHNIILGSHTFIEGFEEQIIGMCANEEKDISVRFPDDYRAEELAGKPAVFAVKVKEIKRKEMPELDDEFAKDVSSFDTLDAYKADIRKNLQEQSENRANNEQDEIILAAIAKDAKAEIPDVMYDNEADAMIREFAQNIAMRGINIDQWMQYTGQTYESMKEQNREEAQKRVMNSLVLDKIRTTEAIEAGDEDVDAEIASYAERAKADAEDYKSRFDEDSRGRIKDMLSIRKTLAFLRENACYTGVTLRKLHEHGDGGHDDNGHEDHDDHGHEDHEHEHGDGGHDGHDHDGRGENDQGGA